jgi:hypothetical protein
MFRYELSETAELRLLEERHAEELSALTNRSRNYLTAVCDDIDPYRTRGLRTIARFFN